MNVCPVCGCEQSEGLLCHNDTTRLERDLGDVAAIVAELDTTLAKMARIGTPGKAGLARERMPYNQGASIAADVLTNVLASWVIDICGEDWPFGPKPGPPSFARDLLNHIPAIRRHPAVTELVDEISDAIRQARQTIDRPADRIYLGTCMVPDAQDATVTCMAELYARPTASSAVCKSCGIEHNVAERRAWLLQRAEDMIVTVREASSYLGEIGGIKMSQASIRGYLHRGKLAYRPGVTNGIRLGDLLAVVIDEGERRSA